VKRAIDVGLFGELADPRVAARLAARAEERGWDGFFVWDHIAYRAPVRAVADPWVALAAVACATSRVRIGALVTPLSRRRVHKVARETATLDLLSSGRLIFGAGLGSARNNELEPFGEVTDPRERARLLDHGLDALARYWAGEFEPVPVQRPRPPVWVAGEWPHRRPVRRALCWGRPVHHRPARPRGAGRTSRRDPRRPPRRRPVRPDHRASPGHRPRAMGAGRPDLGGHGLRPAAYRGGGPGRDRRRPWLTRRPLAPTRRYSPLACARTACSKLSHSARSSLASPAAPARRGGPPLRREFRPNGICALI